MQLRFAHRWSLTLLLVAVLALVVSALLSRWALHRGFDDYLMAAESERWQPLISELASQYVQDGWNSLRSEPRQFDQLMQRFGPTGALNPALGPRRPPRPPPRPRLGAADDPLPPPLVEAAQTRPPPPPSVIDDAGNYIAGARPPRRDRVPLRLPVKVEGKDVGWLLLRDPARLSNGLTDGFVRRQGQIHLAIGLSLLAVFAALAWWMSRQIGRPLSEIGASMRRLSSGDYEHRINAGRSDEFGELAERCNRLAATLESARNAQQRWLADIAHELRTPLTIIRGELQAAEDGVRPLDARMRQSLQAETERLASLVEDLRTLALADEGGLVRRHEPIELRSLVTETLESFIPRLADRNLSLVQDIAKPPLWVDGDADALSRAIINLLENCCRYTDAAGQVSVTLRGDGRDVLLQVDDSAPSVSTEALPRLFERFYRGEDSRNRASGGSGLGLAIVAGIVKAHHGEIHAEDSPLGGLRVAIRLPPSPSKGRAA